MAVLEWEQEQPVEFLASELERVPYPGQAWPVGAEPALVLLAVQRCLLPLSPLVELPVVQWV